MTPAPDPQRWLQTDEDVFVVQVLANDPRAFATESILISGPARGIRLADLEAVQHGSETRVSGASGTRRSSANEAAASALRVRPCSVWCWAQLERSRP